MYLNKRMSAKFEKRATRDLLRKQAMSGQGVYLFQNNSPKAELCLPKPANNGLTRVGPNGTFEGDSYFFSLVRTNQLKLIKEIETVKLPEEEILMSEEKLILDQPERVTSEGTVESVISNPPKTRKKNESRINKTQDHDVLLNEDPMSGVEILNG